MRPSNALREKFQRDLRSSRLKLGVMVVLLVGVLTAMFQLAQRGGNEGDDGGEPALTGGSVPPGRSDGPDATPYGKTPDTLGVSDEEVQKDFPFMTDPKTLEQIRDQDLDLEPGPFFYMLYRVFRDTDEQLASEADPEPQWKTLWEAAPSARGKPIRVEGRILAKWRQPLGKSPMGLDCVWAYRVRPENAPIKELGHLYDIYSIQKLKGANRHDKVATCGRFLKARIIEPEGPNALEDPDLHVAVVVARRFEPLTYLDEPEIPKPIVQGNRPEVRAFNWLLQRARDVPFAELKARAEANAHLTHLDFMNRPESYVAKPVVLRGELLRLVPMRLDENPMDIPQVFYGQVADTDRKLHAFYCLHVPEGIRLKDPVLLYGYYMKNWTYISRAGHELSSPVVVAQRMQVITVATDYTLELIIGCVVGVTALLLLVAHSRERAREMAIGEGRRQRQLARTPKDLNAIARRRAAAARGHDAEPASGEAPSPESGEAKGSGEGSEAEGKETAGGGPGA